MAYPNFAQIEGSARQLVCGERVDRSENGFPRKRILFSKSYYEFKIVHNLAPDEWQSLMQHYEDNKDTTFQFQWIGDGQQYLVEYMASPIEKMMVGGMRDVEVRLRSVG